jgi:transposase IS66 family protein
LRLNRTPQLADLELERVVQSTEFCDNRFVEGRIPFTPYSFHGRAAHRFGVGFASSPLRPDRVIIDTLVRKYADHCPLYRQSSILKRDTGIEISRGNMCGWILRVGDLLIPVAGVVQVRPRCGRQKTFALAHTSRA